MKPDTKAPASAGTDDEALPIETPMPWLPRILALAGSGLLSVLICVSVDRTSVVDVYVTIGMLCVLVVALGFAATMLLNENNRKGEHSTALYWQLERHYSAAVNLLIDNPALANNGRIRAALMPSDGDLKVYKTSPSHERHLREVRNGTSWLTKGTTTHSGPSLAIDLERTSITFYKDRTARAWRERNRSRCSARTVVSPPTTATKRR